MQGSNDYNCETGEGSFVNLYNSKESLDFFEWNKKYDFAFSNNNSYNHYAVLLEKTETTEKMCIRHFALVQFYARQIVTDFQE